MTGVDRRRSRSRVVTLLGGSLALTLTMSLALAACGGGDDEPSAEESSASAAASASPGDEETEVAYLPVPDDVELTEPGSELSFGETASVAWRPDATTTGVLDVTVGALQRAPLSAFSGFRLDKQTRQSAAYFVRVRVANIGESDLAGTNIPLYLLDEADTLIEASSFASRFGACPSAPLPRGFIPGEEIVTCLVYLAPDKGDAEAVSFRPTQEFDPIVWTGKQTKFTPKDQRKKKSKKKGQ